MVSAIILIVIGYVVWQMVPGWIHYGPSSARQLIQLICNIVGIIMVILGVIDLIYAIIGIFR